MFCVSVLIIDAATAVVSRDRCIEIVLFSCHFADLSCRFRQEFAPRRGDARCGRLVSAESPSISLSAPLGLQNG
jgi:hypothetical protein